MNRFLPLALTALALCASASAAPEWLVDAVARRGNEHAFVAVKYTMPPSMQDNFVDEWQRFEKELKHEKGLMHYVLSTTLDDNYKFWAYYEWDTYKDWLDHFDNKYVKVFKDFQDDNDIQVEILPLEAVGDAKKEWRRSRSADVARSRGRWDEEDPRDLPSFVMFQFHVPPSMMDEFEDTILDVRDMTMDEKEVRHYAVRKVANTNHHYIACGAWESFEGWLDHFTSKRFRTIKQFTAKNDIRAFATPMRPLAIGGYEEERE